MTCRDVARFLADYLSGELEPDVRARFDRHLAVCPNCRAYLATYTATIALSRAAFAAAEADAAIEAPEDLVNAVLDSLRLQR